MKHGPFPDFARAFLIGLAASFVLCPEAKASDSWEQLDKRVKNQVYQLNVSMEARTKSGWAQLVDLSPQKHYPVFATTSDDKGFRVVGFGTAFAIRTARTDKKYFLTNKHVVEYGEGFLRECQRF